MDHATIYIDQERLLGFVHQRLEAGEGDLDIVRAAASWEALETLGHVITDEDLVAAVRYVRLLLDEHGPAPLLAVDCIGYLRRILTTHAA